MFIISDYEEQVMHEIDAIARLTLLKPINLGGVAGVSGGAGGPPAGFIGQLAQRYVTFDTTEAADPDIPISGASLITNLNRIRAGVALGDGVIHARHLADDIVTDAAITVQGTDGIPELVDIRTLRFNGATIATVTSGLASITYDFTSGSGGAGSGLATYGWYLDGRAAPYDITTQVHKFNNNFTVRYLTIYTPYPSVSTTISGCIKTSHDEGATWDLSIPFTVPTNEVYSTFDVTPDFTIASGMLVGIRLDSGATDGPNNLNVIMNGVEAGIGGGGGGVSDGEFVTYAPIAGVTLGAVRPELKNYDPDLPPGSPSVYDDEFDDDTVDAKWHIDTYDSSFNLYQTDGSRHVSESLRHGVLTLQGDFHFQGPSFYQDFAPADDNWSLVAKIYPSYNMASNNLISFGIYGASYWLNYYQVRIGVSEDGTIGARSFYNDGGGDFESAMTKIAADSGVYVMICKRLDGEDLKFMTFLSGNGYSWTTANEITMSSLSTETIVALYFGTYSNSNYNIINSIDFVRYFPEAGKINIGGNV